MHEEKGGSRDDERGRLSVMHVAAAVREWNAMSLEQRVARADGIHARQPLLLASVLAQSQLGATLATVELLLEILIVTDLAMHASGFV